MGDLKTNYDAYAGVSAGAEVAGVLGMFPTGQEVEASELLAKLFSVENKDIWKRWFPFGKLSIWKSSALNSSPHERFVRKHFSQEALEDSGKKVRVGAVSLDTQEYRVFDETYPDFASAILASASFPAFFKPILTDGQLWIDGGVRHVTPIKALIDLGCDEIDVSICHPPKAVAPAFERDPEWPDVALRGIEIMSDELIWADLREAHHINRRIALKDPELGPNKKPIKFRLFHPDRLLALDSLKFNQIEAANIRQLAYAKATAITP
jgi:predicted acylesterase/phospholipase RssA